MNGKDLICLREQMLFKLEKLGKKATQYNILFYALQEEYLSAYQMQQLVHSSSADRTMRYIRKDIDAEFPRKYQIISRQKKNEGYNTCDEYKIVSVDNGQLRLI